MRGVRLLAWLQVLVLAVVGVVCQEVASPTTVTTARSGATESAAVETVSLLRWATESQAFVSRGGAAHSLGGRDAGEDALEGDDIEEDGDGDDDPEPSWHVADTSVVAVRGLRAPRNAGQGLRDEPQSDTSCSAMGQALPRGPPAA